MNQGPTSVPVSGIALAFVRSLLQASVVHMAANLSMCSGEPATKRVHIVKGSLAFPGTKERVKQQQVVVGRYESRG